VVAEVRRYGLETVRLRAEEAAACFGFSSFEVAAAVGAAAEEEASRLKLRRCS